MKKLATENIPCQIKESEKLRKLTKKKYGKLKGVFNVEISEAVKEHCKRLEKELSD